MVGGSNIRENQWWTFSDISYQPDSVSWQLSRVRRDERRRAAADLMALAQTEAERVADVGGFG